jgi:predicted nucleic acid-binding protein
MFDTNVLFDFFLGRDPEILLLASLSRQYVEIRVPDFVLMEFRGSILKELGKTVESLMPFADWRTSLSAQTTG